MGNDITKAEEILRKLTEINGYLNSVMSSYITSRLLSDEHSSINILYRKLQSSKAGLEGIIRTCNTQLEIMKSNKKWK